MREEVSIVIPNFNGRKYLEGCLKSLDRQKMKQFEVILVDNGSTDGSSQWALAQYPQIKIIQFSENTGFCKAVNEGIKAAETPYVLLLNNDMEVKENFVSEMLAAIKRHKKAFACQAKMVSFYDRSLIDDAGNYYCALGWAFARGKAGWKIIIRKRRKSLPAAEGPPFTGKNYLTGLDILMKSTLPIWKIWTLDIGPGFSAIRTGSCPGQWFTISEAEPPVPGIISLRPVIPPEIMSICFTRICRQDRLF